MTYNEDYDKIIDAYFNDEIKPMESQFCFCGTLCGGASWIYIGHSKQFEGYTFDNLKALEAALLNPLIKFGIKPDEIFTDTLGNWEGTLKVSKKGYEKALFKGMSDALEVLKQIHIDRGEEIDPLPTLTKRVFSDQIKVKI